MSMSEYCPVGYTCLAYDGFDKMRSVINALHNLNILDDSQHEKSQVYCQENQEPSCTFR